MRIEKPAGSEQDLIIAYDLIDSETLNYAIKSYVSFLYNVWPDMDEETRRQLGYVPHKNDFLLYEEAFEEALGLIRAKTIMLMESEFDNFKIERFQDFGKPSLRSTGSQMKPHVDGPPEIDSPDHSIDNLGANFYFNDDYVGGELYYPNLNFSYKPVPNSVVIHRSNESTRHGIKPVEKGWRLSLGMFAFAEDYELPRLQTGLNSD